MNQSLFPEFPILLVDDEKHFLNSMVFNLSSKGLTNVLCCEDSRNVMPLLKEKKFSLILLDILMPNITGTELLPQIMGNYPDIPVTLLTAESNTETVVDCMRNGAFDYLVKPIEPEKLIKKVRQALDFLKAKKEDTHIQQFLFSETPKNKEAFSGIITQNNRMIQIFKYIEAIAVSPMPVLITGEIGDGKDLIARAIFKLSERKGEFVCFNAGAADEQSFADSLFGYKNSAAQEQPGFVEKAKDGVLFLDEIGDISEKSQIALLPLIQNKEYYPRGSNILKTTNARFIAATCKDLPTLVKERKFRNDLYHRLKIHHIQLPPLRERKDDIPLLVDYFLKKSAEILKKKKPYAPKELFILLSKYDFPGNIRELATMVYDALTVHESGPLSIDMFRNKIRGQGVELDIPTTSRNELIDKKVTFGEPFPNLKNLKKFISMRR
jgi:DNA-binding NtrC family response regulator